MNSHQMRLLVIGLAFLAVLAALVIGAWMDAGIEVLAPIAGALVPLTPALIDAAAVERRRRNPAKRAISDDVVTNTQE